MKQFLKIPFLKFLSFGETGTLVIGLDMIPTYDTVLAEVSYEFGSIHTSIPPLQHKISIIVGLPVFFLLFCMKFDSFKVRKVAKLGF